MKKIGIVGVGFIGDIHSKAYKRIKNARVVAVVDLNEEKGKKIAKDFDAEFYSDFEKFLEKEEVDVVDICTPTYMHKYMTIRAADAKKDIFCEKPIALTLEDANEVIKAVKENNVKAMVGHVLRFWPEYVEAKKIIESRELGEILNIFCERIMVSPDWHYKNWGLREELMKGGGVAVEAQIHDIDYLLWILGMPTHIKSEGLYKPELGGWAHIVSNFKFQDSKFVTVEAGWAFKGSFPFTMVLRILCEKGTVEWIFRAGKNIEEREQKAPLMVYKADGSIHYPKVELEDPYFLELKYFIDCLKKGKYIDNATMEDGRKALEVVLASMKSAKENKIIEL